MTNVCFRLTHRLLRRKQIGNDELSTDLKRCLTLIDLTALGIGSTIGAGAYVIAGQVAKQDAGPAVIVSFLIAAVASVLAGLCYAEFGARVPKAGSAYVYTYVTVGELMAFIIGWNLILEYVIGTASVARTASGYFDDLIGHKLVPWFNETLPMNVHTLAPYADFLAVGVTLALTALLAIGVKESAVFTKIFTALNLIILAFIIIAGMFKDDVANWHLSHEQVSSTTDDNCGNEPEIGCGQGGFAPYGFAGIIKGAATCFFAFVGFDAIATTGEEAQNPRRAIPLATVASLSIVFLVYFGISVTITMMAPYHLLDMQAPFAAIFENVGWVAAKYVVSVGAICALTTSLLGSMLPMPRVILAMARDGLIFRQLAYIHPKLKTPLVATLVSGCLAALMAAIFNVAALVEMMSIGTLLAYTLVSASVLLLRYDVDPEERERGQSLNNDQQKGQTWTNNNINQFNHRRGSSPGSNAKCLIQQYRLIGALFAPSVDRPTLATARLVKILTAICAACLIGIGSLLNFATVYLFENRDWWAVFLLTFLIFVCLASLISISRQPESQKQLHFQVPHIPVFASCSMFFNIYLMLNLDPLTWARFLLWMIIGLAVYFFYGMSHSSEEQRRRAGSVQHCTKGDQQTKDALLPPLKPFH